jgi:DNA-binding Lrp family transcriptional regulator
MDSTIKLDLKDRRILYQLDIDSRQSLTQIGKKVGLKKDVVSYRIQRMQDEGVIKNFWTLIDAYKLGYIIFRFYLVFQYTNPEVKNKIIDYLAKDKHTCVINSIIGK